MEIIKVDHITKEFTTYEKGAGLKGIFKSFFNAKKVIKKAISDVSFSVQEGDIIGYIGPNGAGKSTTIKILTGILTPSSGEVVVDGVIPYKKRTANAQKIGVVFGQRTQLWWDLPLNESFTVLKEIYQIKDSDFKERMNYFDEIFGINQFIKQPVRQLSLGQRMKADIAASFIHNPKIVFLDEPTIGLDVVAKENIRKTIKDLNKRFNTTVILTTHDLSDIEELCNRILMIDKGKLIYDGTLDKLRELYGSKKIITFELKNIEEVESINIENQFLSIDKDIKVFSKDNSITVIFNKNKLDIKDITYYVLNNVNVIDIDIKDDDLEHLIKEIYTMGLV